MSEKCPKCHSPLKDEHTVCPYCRTIIVEYDEQPDQLFSSEQIIPPGTVIADAYQIVRMVGMGGAGIVYEARELTLANMPVALKVLHRDLNEDVKAVNLLKKEVIVARELSHENILKVHSLGKMEDRHFIVMEYVEGDSLQMILDKAGKCSLETIGPVFAATCHALQYAHDRGILHLDIKPANILIGTSGATKLCDFGIARMAIANVTTATQRITTGSFGFMPPEQYKGRQYVSTKSDIYSLGAVMCTAITGEVPIGILDDEAIPVSVLKAMRRKPEDRYETVREFYDAFFDETGLRELVEEGINLRAATIFDELPLDSCEEAAKIASVPSSTTEDSIPLKISPKAPSPIGALESEKPMPLFGRLKVLENLLKKIKGRPGVPFWKSPVHLVGLAVVAMAIALIVGLSQFSREIRLNKSVKTVQPDAATVKEVERTLTGFVESLNFNRDDQAFMFLSKPLRQAMTILDFREAFFNPARLWRMKVVETGKTSDGKVLVKLEFRVTDAYGGTSKTLKGTFYMVKQDLVWKISLFELI